jgi:SAM-dependent methyltransferase
MERLEYAKLDRVEDRMWWFRATHKNLLTLSRRQISRELAGRPILDAGCGTGGLLRRLATYYPENNVVGIDTDIRACARAAGKSARPICVGSVNDLPFASGTFGVIFSADVLCHRRVDEGTALLQFHRCLAENGWLVLNLPAYRWMLSRHDVAVHNARRYTLKRVARLLHSSGFQPVYVTYWNAVLFPLMVITRKLLPARRSMSDVTLHSRPLDAFGRLATSFENALLRAGLRFPFGGSILAVAAKRGASDD